ncbi:beta-lactamase/transpeptidase-like protein [Polyplosphaeria fusca]|uniref:Beta-lactamase/transpeptidase-like protein n=1 Tax=Polyplosphaeria fusca TaxID=682080 RepID=A0A9P4QND5_9PLEO|nr:beta-lactamase/transpeptidase-like protein [Polyplosphaeria fusca]
MAHATPAFDRLVEDEMKHWKVPGLAIAVVHKNEIFAKGYGVAKLSGEKVTPKTLFDCASMSKSFTSAALALLIDNKEQFPDLKWNTPVSKLMPEEFVLADPLYTEQVTIEDILCHRTGLPGHESSYLSSKSANPDTAETITRNLRNLPLNRPLRTEFQYNNIMFTAASYLAESLSGQSFKDIMHSRFWGPMQMSNTYYDIEDIEAHNATDRLSNAHYWDKETEMFLEIPQRSQPEGQGAGCIFSCAEDWVKWVQVMINRDGPLSKDAHKELVKPRMVENDDMEDFPMYSTVLYAFGWDVQYYRGHSIIGHNGGVPGFASMMKYLPDQQWGLVILTNSSWASEIVEVLLGHLMDELLNVAADDRTDWASHWRHRWDVDEEARAKRQAYPHPYLERPDPPQKLEVSLEDIAGTYRNAGYQNFVLTVEGNKLFADMTDRCYPFNMILEHFSGNDLVARIQAQPEGFESKLKARLELDPAKKVTRLGIAFEGDMGDDLIWFEKIS